MKIRLSARKARAFVSLFLAMMLLAGPVVGQPKPDDYPTEVKFMGSPLGEVVDIYGRVTGKTPLIAPRVNVNALITVKGKNKLTKEEYIAALESILALHDVAIIPHGDKFVKVVSAVEGTKHAMETEVDPQASSAIFEFSRVDYFSLPVLNLEASFGPGHAREVVAAAVCPGNRGF